MEPRFSEDFWSGRTDTADENLRPASQAIEIGAPIEPHAVDLPPAWREADPGPLVRSIGRRRLVFVPEGYESNYPYPLVIWLHGAAGSHRDLQTVMPQISTRNYLGLSLRATAADGRHGSDVCWPEDGRGLGRLEREIRASVRRLRRDYHVHTERIFLAGFDDGATTALRLLLRRPEWFGGAIALCGRSLGPKLPLARFRELNGKPVLLGTGIRDEAAPIEEMIDTARMLHSAGLRVSLRVCDAAHEPAPKMFSQIDEWIMSHVWSAVGT